MFICVEGIDGSGKSSQVKRIADYCNAMVVPGCSDRPLGKLVRQALSGEVRLTPDELQCAFTADRLARDFELRQLHDRGKNLVADRWTMSGLIYGALHLISNDALAKMQWISELNRNVIVPDIYFVLAIDPEIAWRRILQRGLHTEIYETPESMKKLAHRYDVHESEIWEPNSEVFRMDANRDEAAVWNDIQTVLDERFENGSFRYREMLRK